MFISRDLQYPLVILFGALIKRYRQTAAFIPCPFKIPRDTQPGTEYTPQCMLKPILASSYHSGI